MTVPATRNINLWLLSALLAVAFTAFQIQSSLHSGALALPVTYDDVMYFTEALVRLETLYHEGGWAALKGFWTSPPHAPLQTLLAMGGFSLLGRHPWAADAFNAVPLALLLRLFLGFASRSLPIAMSVGLAAALLGFPLMGLLIVEFRPDALCALLTATGSLVVVADLGWRARQRSSMALSSVLLATALLAKPTLAPVTVVVFGSAVLAVMCLRSKSVSDARHILLTAIISGGAGALIALPYYIAAFSHLYDYIQSNVFGAQANIWHLKLSWQEDALYYLTGPGGKAAIGAAWLALLCALIVASLPALLRFRRTALGVTAVALVAYLSVAVTSYKTPFIGLIVPAVFLGILAILSITILTLLPRRIAAIATLCFLVFSVGDWRSVPLRLWGGAMPAAKAQNLSRIHAQTVDAIASLPDIQNRKLYFPVIAQYLNAENIEFELRRRKLPLPDMPRVAFAGEMKRHNEALNGADLIILFSEGSTLPLEWLPSAQLRKDITTNIMASDAFEPLASIGGGSDLGTVMILKRKGT